VSRKAISEVFTLSTDCQQVNGLYCSGGKCAVNSWDSTILELTTQKNDLRNLIGKFIIFFDKSKETPNPS